MQPPQENRIPDLRRGGGSHDGAFVPHAGAKYLVPLARANRGQCERLARAIAPGRLSSRQVGEVYAAWRTAAPEAREHLVDEPMLFLRTKAAQAQEPRVGRGVGAGLIGDVTAISAMVRRATRRIDEGAVRLLMSPERKEARGALGAARAGIDHLLEKLEDDTIGDGDARRSNAKDDSQTLEKGAVDSTDCPRALDLAGGGA